MKTLTEAPAVLTVHTGAEGQYILRVADVKYRSLVVGVSKLLEDAESFVLITPTDVKVFKVGENGEKPQTISEESEAETSAAAGEMDYETLQAIAEQEGHPLPGEETDLVADQPVEVKPVRRRGRPKSEVAGHDEICGRCKGKGQIQAIMPDGSATDTACGICQGKGVIRRYGVR